LNPLAHPANVTKDVGEPSYLHEIIHCLKMHVLAAQKDKPKSMHVFNLLQTNYVFCTCFELFISVGLQQTMGLPSLILFLLDNASLYSSSMF